MVRYTNQLSTIAPLAGHHKVAIDLILDFSICGGEPVSHTWTKVATVLQITEGAAMFSLVIFQFAQQSLQMYSVTRQWQINRYMNILVKQGIQYFFAYVRPILSFPVLPSNLVNK